MVVLANASFLHLRLVPGTHTLKAVLGMMAKTSKLAIDVKASSTSFYRYEFVTGILFNHFHIGSSIEPKDHATALAELKDLQAVK